MDFLASQLCEGMSEGIRKAAESLKPTLISQTFFHKNIDSLSFFTNARLNGEPRIFYWSSPDNDAVFVGVGAAWTASISEPRSDRFAQVEKAWSEILSRHLSLAPEISRVSGPILLGGGAFDFNRPASGTWEDFPVSEFFVPQILFWRKDGKSGLTINCLLSGDENPELLAQSLIRKSSDLAFDRKRDPQFPAQNPNFSISETDLDLWKNAVRNIVRKIDNGEVEKVVLARELNLQADAPFDPSTILLRLSEEQRGASVYAYVRGENTFIGASPERIIKSEKGRYYSASLAGSIKCGNTAEESVALGNWLLHDRKNRNEHEIVLRMIIETLQKYCEPLETQNEPQLLRLKNIQHLYTPVAGKALAGSSLLTVLDDLHPTPALCGASRREAIKYIEEFEPMPRGWYAGPIGWVDSRGDGEFSAAIRCGLLHGKTASLYAGCGIVASSDPESEFDETNIKFRPMLDALAMSEQLCVG